LYAIPQVIDQLSFKMDVSLEEKQNSFFDLSIDSGSYEGATSALKSTFSFMQRNVMEMGNQLLIKTIGDAKVVCGGDDENDNNSMLNLLIGLLVVLIPLYILSHILFLLDNKPNDQEEEREEGHSPTELRSYEFRNAFAGLMKKDISLFTKERISFNTRHFFPIMLISTLALLITSNLSVGATVDLSFSTKNPKDTFQLPSLFTFSLGNTVHDMYESKIYVLLFIVVIFSGAWPYMKLILMMWTWMAPESKLSSQNRGLLLYTLDALSKFSLVDTFVLIIMMVSFRFKVQVGDAIVDLFVNPHFGFYGFLLATTISLLVGRAALHLHRKSSMIFAINHSDQSIPLFSRYFFFNGRKYLISKWFRGIALCCLLITILLLTYGSMKESFKFEVGGLAGVILGDEKSKSFSLLSIGTFIPMSVDDAYSSGSMLLQVIYFFYVGIMPMSCLLSLIFLLVVPLSYPQQEHFITFAEIANAWSAIEVFVLSILAALLELPTFAAFIVGHKCDIINQILVDKFHDVLNGQDTCYSLQAHVAFNVTVLLLGVALNSFLVSNLLRLSRVVLLQHYDQNSYTFKTLEILMDSSWREYFFDSVDDDSTLDQPLLGDS
jgi:Paraquat-inducible protein A